MAAATGSIVSTSIAATVGALIVYTVARSALGEALRKKAERDQGMMQKVCEAIDKDTFWYVLASRLAVVEADSGVRFGSDPLAVHQYR